MQPLDRLCRSIIFPKGFTEGVLDEAVFLQFDQLEGSESYVLSLGSMYLLGSVGGAHAYGCHTAAKQRARYEQRTGEQPPPLGQNSRHYVGYYEFYYAELMATGVDGYSVSVRWRPEDSPAHFQIELDPVGHATKTERKRARLDARTAFALALFGQPERHVCECDGEYAEELSAIELPPRASAMHLENASSK